LHQPLARRQPPISSLGQQIGKPWGIKLICPTDEFDGH
jgi:hypothetical protein